MSQKYAIPGFTKGKFFCSLQNIGSGVHAVHAKCQMAVIKIHRTGFIEWGGKPDCKNCEIPLKLMGVCLK